MNDKQSEFKHTLEIIKDLKTLTENGEIKWTEITSHSKFFNAETEYENVNKEEKIVDFYRIEHMGEPTYLIYINGDSIIVNPNEKESGHLNTLVYMACRELEETIEQKCNKASIIMGIAGVAIVGFMIEGIVIIFEGICTFIVAIFEDLF